jgi:type 1 glutamine amidotransferase
MLPSKWPRRDEWYDFRSNPRDSVQVLLTLDESTYEGGTMGNDHPIAWYHKIDGGRAWYTALGHTKASYRAPLFRQHLLGGLRWAAGTD